jgi:cytochrome oxidase Cu insertion factor (SCO1/SenC/PrrC family)
MTGTMTGMGGGLQTDNSTVASAFRSALDHQLLIVVLLLVGLVLAWNVVRTISYRRAVTNGTLNSPVADPHPYPEPVARHMLRITFGVLWVFDGVLQLQGSMPVGLPGSVITPAANSSPGWVQHLVNVGATIWSDHPVSAAAATVWIQVGIGLFLLAAPRGYWSRAAGAVSAGWGLVVWVFGEAFGGIFGHGSSLLFGSPGAVLFYAVAGVLIALPESSWESARMGKAVLRASGVFFVGMGVLQAWPGRGFWSGQAHPTVAPGTLTAMVDQMAHVGQPAFTASWVRAFASFDAAHGWAVNLAVVVLLIGIGACFMSSDPRYLRLGVGVAAVFCAATWIFVQDFGFLGGLGTDPNSMIPLAAVFVGGYLAVVRLPVRSTVGSPTSDAADTMPVGPTTAAGDRPRGYLERLSPTYLVRTLAAVAAVGIVIVGAAPMAVAAVNPNADPILTEATDGSPNVVNLPAAPFTLTDQQGRQVSLASLAGHTVVLTFLDPVCTSDCPLIAQELRTTDQMLGAQASKVDLVAVVNNPLYDTVAMTNAFDRQEGLQDLPNWSYLTGSLTQLRQVWNDYGVQTQVTPAGAMIAHSDIVYVIDAKGRTREILDADPGAGTSASESSFSSLLASQLQHIAQS